MELEYVNKEELLFSIVGCLHTICNRYYNFYRFLPQILGRVQETVQAVPEVRLIAAVLRHQIIVIALKIS